MMVLSKKLAPALVVAALLAPFGPASAQTACPDRVPVRTGDTMSGIAQTCGINLQALRSVNPGINARTMQPGTVLNVPRPALPSPREPIGSGLIEVVPRMEIRPTVSAPPITPPVRQPIPRQHIIRGFGNDPGQLPLPPGHDITPIEPFPLLNR